MVYSPSLVDMLEEVEIMMSVSYNLFESWFWQNIRSKGAESSISIDKNKQASMLIGAFLLIQYNMVHGWFLPKLLTR